MALLTSPTLATSSTLLTDGSTSTSISLVAQPISTVGLVPTYQAAAAGGDTMIAGSDSFLYIKNDAGSAMQVTLVTPATVDTLAIDDRIVTVGAGSARMIAVPDSLYRNPLTGSASILYSSVTAVTVAALRR